MFVLLVTVVTASVVAFHNLSDSTSLQPVDQTRKRVVDLKPEAAYNLIHTILFGVLALSTMRYSRLVCLT